MDIPKIVADRRKALSEQLEDLKGQPVPDVLTKNLPYIRKKPNIRRVIVHLHKIFQSYSQKTAPFCMGKEKKSGSKRDKDPCAFCRYHVEIMDDNFKDESSEIKVCQETNVVYLMYCIHCDEVFLGFTEKSFGLLLNIRFGFLDDKECEPEKGHNKRYLRCIIIDKKDGQFSKSFLEKDETQMSMWENVLNVKMFTNKNERHDVSKNGLCLSQQYHCINDSEVKIYCALKLPLLNCKSENIVYLIVCNNCHIRYVGRASSTFLVRYPKGFSEHYLESPFHLHTDAEGSECTFRDFRWSVIDALNKEQNEFLNKWKRLYDKFNREVKTKIWAVISNDFGSFRDPLKKILILTNDVDMITNYVKAYKINLNQVESMLEKMNTKKLSEEAFLELQNKKWIKNTKQAFIEDMEDHWIRTLQVVENGLNTYNASRTYNISANLYNEDFKNLGKK